MLRVRTIFSGVSGSPWYSNLFFDADGGAPEALAASNLTLAFWDALQSIIKENISVAVQPDVTEIDPTLGEIVGVENVPQSPFLALGAQDMLPPATQGLVTLRTGVYRTGRPVIGKIFIPGLIEQVSANGVLAPATVTTVQNAADALVAGVPGSAELVVWSRPKLTSVVPPALLPGAAIPVVSATAASNFAVLRSRRD